MANFEKIHPYIVIKATKLHWIKQWKINSQFQLIIFRDYIFDNWIDVSLIKLTQLTDQNQIKMEMSIFSMFILKMCLQKNRIFLNNTT